MNDQSPAFQHPPKWAFFIWYAFLLSWMQGMAVLNAMWPLLLMAGIPYLAQGIRRIHPLKWLWVPWLAYEAIRIASTLLSIHPSVSWYALIDDVRYTSIALMAAIFIRNQDDLKRSAWFSFAGFAILAWTSLIYQLAQHGDLIMHENHVRYGVFGHVNYAAIWSAIIMSCAFIVMIHIPFRRSWPMLLLIVPMAILQLPLGSRTTLLVGAVGLVIYTLIAFATQHRKKALIISLLLMAGLATGLKTIPGGISQFGHIEQYIQQASGKDSLPSMAIRLEIFKLIAHLVQGRPLGLGPHSQKSVDLNAERDWIIAHMPATLKYGYGIHPLSERAQSFDFNHPWGQPAPMTSDPHSQYADTLVETGWIGLLALFGVWGSVGRQALRLRKSPHPCCRIVGESTLAMLWFYALAGISAALMHQSGGIIFFTAYIVTFICPLLPHTVKNQ